MVAICPLYEQGGKIRKLVVVSVVAMVCLALGPVSRLRTTLGAGRRREGRVYPVATPRGAKIAAWYGRGRTSVATGNHNAGGPW
jgi:hypothetical protein